ncbi:uncharacterized protein LOC119689059 [Teleopsis dalmanni]|uniref:uncharacterized protein LOC119680452 n=1 Tax=Teleopsis dalmanni TaxID=139649 RepID=UPI000D32B029|nr:uncharacterized protein LOC119680452 [Teleopsis dalmanni]XP_037959728.1 uncharacterized protein LOC119689059 [Teleopsis dalmanni]
MRGPLNSFVCVWLVLCFTIAQAGQHDTSAGSVVKKDLNLNATRHVADPAAAPQDTKVVIISEKTPAELQAVKQKVADENNDKNANNVPALPSSVADNNVKVEERNFKQTIFQVDSDMPDSFKAGFYVFLALSCGAVMFIVFKVYRMRLSRAERKYGVQGDRSTQELTPLPIEIEDGNSDDEDQTLFDRQQIRIL